ncbi:MAG TPA: ABC transporter permease [Solirubrobacteraceae bacterium]|nr:ABC transporter permease [Solirubrobacteraceae bacterium]
MRASNIASFYVVRLRARLVQELFAVLGIAVGVALLFASQVANTSLGGSVEQLTSGIVGKSRLQLEARSPLGFSERLLGEVQRLPGVRQAAPVLETSAYLVGPTGREAVDLIGLDPSFVHLDGALLRHFSVAQLAAQRVLALPEPIAQRIGSGALSVITLDANGRSTRAVVGLTLQAGDVGALVHSPFAAAPLSYVQQLAGIGRRITRVLVQPQLRREGQVRVELNRLAAGRLNVRPANFDARVFRQAEEPNSQSGELFSVVSALVGFLFAFNALLLTVPQRRRLIVDLRLDGYAPWEVIEVLVFDALVLGVIGSLLGLLLGDLLSITLLRANPGYLSFAFPVGTQRIVTWQCFVVAVGGGLLAACVGVLIPLKDIFARAPLVAKAPAERIGTGIVWMTAGGVACLATASVVLLTGVRTVQVAVVGFVSLVAATLLLLPILLAMIVAGFDRLQRGAVGVSPRLAIIELQSSSIRMRSAAIAATGAIAVFGSVAIGGAQRNLESGLGHAAADLNLVADLWVTPSGMASTLATVPFQNRVGDVFSRLRRDVRAVRAYRGSFLDLGDRRVLVIAPPRASTQPIPATQVVRGSLLLARARIREHGWAVLSQAVADELNLHIGQPFTLPTPRPGTFRLAAATTNLGWPPGAIIVNAEDYAHAWGSRDLSAYQIELQPGIQPAVGRLAIQRALGSGSGFTVQTAAQRERTDLATQRQGLSRLSQIATLVLIAAVLAMAAAMGALIWQRRPRLASLKVDGYDDGELWRALLCESALLLGAGCSVGALFGLYGQLLLSHALATVTGFPVDFSVAPLIALGALALVTATAVVIVAIPGYFAARVEPALAS